MKFAGYFVYCYAATLYVASVVPTSVVVVYEGTILCIFESNTSFSNAKVRFEI